MKLKNSSDMLTKNQTLDLLVSEVSGKDKKINLSLKNTTDDHWLNIDDFYKVNQNINAIIKSPVSIDPIKSSDEELLDHFKSNSTTIYHPCGTCRMSKSIAQGVVSEKLKVHGIDNLWIVDASIMPNITSGNINAPVMMLSHLSSKIILEELKQNYL